MADKMATTTACPEWTECQKKRGQDPLGMQTSSLGIYQKLLPGISNVTLRIRYYGLYAWLCRIYATQIGDTNPKTWQRFVRRAEALYALIAKKRGGESGVAGIEWAKRTLEFDDQEVDFATASEPGSDEYYLKQAWGAYGAAYASQLYEVGIFAVAEGHEIPVPSSEIGNALAEAFADALGPLAEQFLHCVQKGSVTLAELDTLSPLTPSQISPASQECECYHKILFSQAGLDRPNDRERRLTLLLILHLTDRIKRIPRVSEVRWMLYTNLDHDGKPLVFGSPELSDHRVRWWIYQANELTHIAYETLFKYVLDLLERYPSGITLGELISEAVETIRSSVKIWPQSWEAHLLQNATDDPNVEAALCEVVLQEARLDRVCSPKGAWSALTLLAVVHTRARAAKQKVHDELGQLNPIIHSLLSEFTFLGSHSSSDFGNIVNKLIEHRIIKRHLWVALRKLRYQGDYTFLVESDNGQVRLRGKDGPIETNPRLDPAITFLKDTYLINEEGLTEKGREVLGAT